MLWSNSTTVPFGQSASWISRRVTGFPARSISIRKITNDCSRRRIFSDCWAPSRDRSSPDRRSSSNDPSRIRLDGGLVLAVMRAGHAQESLPRSAKPSGVLYVSVASEPGLALRRARDNPEIIARASSLRGDGSYLAGMRTLPCLPRPDETNAGAVPRANPPHVRPGSDAWAALELTPIADAARVSGPWHFGHFDSHVPGPEDHVLATTLSARGSATWTTRVQTLHASLTDGAFTLVPSGRDGHWQLRGAGSCRAVFLAPARLQRCA